MRKTQTRNWRQISDSSRTARVVAIRISPPAVAVSAAKVVTATVFQIADVVEISSDRFVI